MTESNALPMPSHPAGSRRHYQTDGRERVLLVLALGLGFLTADLCLAMWYGVPALGVTLLVLLWEGTLLWYAREGTGLPEKAKRGAGLGLTVAVVLLGLCFSLCVSWLWLLNALALLALLVLQMFQLFGPARRAWSSPLMLAERGFLLLDGLFGQLGAPFQLLLSRKRERGRRRLCILLGLCCVIPLLMLVAPLLASADALFDRLTAETLRFLYEHFGSLLGRLVLGLFLAPFLFSLLYFLRRGEARATGAGQAGTFVVDPALPVTVLLPLDLLYVLFAAVQSAALFRGSAYLEAAGISYAEYARSGFFQLVWVSCINLAVVVAAVHFCRREGKLWLVVWALSTGMVALSCLMLVSAAWRMTLYVSTYGLSVKRLLTYWGMALLAVFFGAALLKIWRRDFGFFRVLLAAGVSGWLLLNLLRVDAVVAEYNVEAYLTGNISALDVAYLAGLSDEALPSLARLPADMSVYEYEEGNTVGRLLEERRVHAARMAGSWRTWNLASWRAARSG
ncbi:DUF4153 domain-containing protein [Intestinimonas butyriciproducens]|nr:DUF4173 domain-containing protein [Intestinimonas butyriciproducens]